MLLEKNKLLQECYWSCWLWQCRGCQISEWDIKVLGRTIRVYQSQ